eukprot:2326288-Rhodomonas_salina.1
MYKVSQPTAVPALVEILFQSQMGATIMHHHCAQCAFCSQVAVQRMECGDGSSCGGLCSCAGPGLQVHLPLGIQDRVWWSTVYR